MYRHANPNGPTRDHVFEAAVRFAKVDHNGVDDALAIAKLMNQHPYRSVA
jgi:hypothetical protein